MTLPQGQTESGLFLIDSVSLTMGQSAGMHRMWLGTITYFFMATMEATALEPTLSPATNSFPSPAPGSAYEPPAVLTAGIYRNDNSNTNPVFRFKRSEKRSHSSLHVLGEYSYPDGKPAVREGVDYQNNFLVRYELDELQTGTSGSATIERDAANPGKGKIVFRYTKDTSRQAAPENRTEPLLADTLVNDMVGRFLAAHWHQLIRGEKVSCRMIVVPRLETIGFTFKKESECQWHGRKVVVLKMEPSSLLIYMLVDPLHFIVERDPPHRVLQYTGRTPPKVSEHGQWKDLDALTVFNW
jgi:hypothetical protein